MLSKSIMYYYDDSHYAGVICTVSPSPPPSTLLPLYTMPLRILEAEGERGRRGEERREGGGGETEGREGQEREREGKREEKEGRRDREGEVEGRTEGGKRDRRTGEERGDVCIGRRRQVKRESHTKVRGKSR